MTPALLLAALIALFHHGPVSHRLRDRAVRCDAPPMALIMADLVSAAERHGVPPAVLASTCLIESGLNQCAQLRTPGRDDAVRVFCGVVRGPESWACRHGADCEPPAAYDGPRGDLYRQLRAAAFLLARQHRFAPSGMWSFAAQGFHLGGTPQVMAACPRHGHAEPYGLLILRWARRAEERALGATTLETELAASSRGPRLATRSRALPAHP